MRHILTAAVVAMSIPAAASAVTIYDGFDASFGDTLSPGGSLQFDFEPDENLVVDFSVSGSGNEDDLVNVTYGFIDGTKYNFTTIVPNPDPNAVGVDAAIGFLPSITTDQPFYVRVLDGIGNEIGFTLSVAATAAPVSPVPLPASGLLLLAGVGGVAAMRRRNKSA